MKILTDRHTYTSFTHTYIYTLREKAYCLTSEKMFKQPDIKLRKVRSFLD